MTGTTTSERVPRTAAAPAQPALPPPPKGRPGGAAWARWANAYRHLVVDYPFNRRHWMTIRPADRKKAARRLMGLTVVGITIANLVVGIETIILVTLVTTGGHLALESADGQSVVAVAAGLVIGAIIDLVLGLVMISPHVRWFVSGGPADDARRHALQRMPMRGVFATVFGWAGGVIAYAVVSTGGLISLAVVSVAFAFAAASSACVTYLVLERASRPLVAAALRDAPAQRPVLGVRERLIVLWVVCSGVPLAGIIAVNIGRSIGWLPPSDMVFDVPTVVLAVLCLASGARTIVLVSKSITDPLRGMRAAVERIKRGDFQTHIDVYDATELGVLQESFNDMADGLAERERLRDLFARYVGTEVAARALRDEVGIHGAQADVAVLYVDIEGSTRFAESADPETVAQMLNRFFTIVAEVVARRGGFINKFEGDAALAVFGAPEPLVDPAAAALRAARELGAELEEIAPLRVGIGVSAGRVFAGNIGAETRYEYTVIGDPVNECARLADLAKSANANVVASGAAIAALIGQVVDVDEEDGSAPGGLPEHNDEFWEWMSTGTVTLRGRTVDTETFAPVALLSEEEDYSDDSGFGDLVDGLIRRPLSLLRNRRG